MSPFTPGSRVEIRNELWIVRKVDLTSDGGYLLTCDGISELVRDRTAMFLTKLEDEILVLNPADTKLVADSSSNYNSTLLYLGSLLRRNIANDEQIHLGQQAVMKLKHYQLTPTFQGLKQPRTRILIADAVGLGKTLEAGILATELIQRGRGKRILVVTQKSMLTQFQKEFWTRFTIPLVRLDSVGLARVRNRIPANHNPFNFYDRSIISMDTLKQNLEYRNNLGNAWWDIIIIDECHNVALRASEQSMSGRARLAKRLATRSDTLILLSATPHDGSARSFASLMNLLDPTAIGDPDHFTKEDYREKGLVVRRFRSDIQQEAGQDFPQRKLSEEKHPASQLEEEAYRALLEIPFTQRGEHRPGLQQELQRVGAQKGLFSSPAAALVSAEKRIGNLQNQETTTAAENTEIKAQEKYIDCLQKIETSEFTKYQCLLHLLRDTEKGWNPANAKDRLVIFSERIETLNWLKENIQTDLKLKSRQIQILHGGMTDTEQQEIVDNFGRLNDPIRLLLCSDVAAEGLNLHYFCHRLIHFDLPWSLMTFQQRNGRIDRFGQTEQPLIYWFANQTKIEKIHGDLRILEILIRKERQAYENLGDPAVFLNVHDPEKEEENVAEIMASGDSAERVEKQLEQNAEQAVNKGMEWAMDFFQPVEDSSETNTTILETHEDVRFFESDWHFVKTGLKELSAAGNIGNYTLNSDTQSVTIPAPLDLQQRLRQIPAEARSKNHQYVLTCNKEKLEDAIEQARQAKSGENTWPDLQFLWPQHPIFEWLIDRLAAHFGRHQAPVIRSQKMETGEQAFILMATIPNKKGQPLLVDWQVAHRLTEQDFQLETLNTLAERLELKAGTLPNPGREEIPQSLCDAVPEAVRVMGKHTIRQQQVFSASLKEKLQKTMASLQILQARQIEQVELQLEKSKQDTRIKNVKRQNRTTEINLVFDDYREWVKSTLETEPEPYIQVLAAFCSWDD
jgi:superfamily II DNA/RNA helicase